MACRMDVRGGLWDSLLPLVDDEALTGAREGQAAAVAMNAGT